MTDAQDTFATWRKTGKRETAWALLVFEAAIAIWAASGSAPALDVLKVLAFPVSIFALGAFGLDAAAKQITWSGR